MSADFNGAKLALYHRGRLIVMLRDDDPSIAWPGYWDFPGGGREGDETPLECALRELAEELAVRLDPELVVWEFCEPRAGGDVWFFVAEADGLDLGSVRLGDEGQAWALMDEAEFLSHDKAIPSLKARLMRWTAQRDAPAFTES